LLVSVDVYRPAAREQLRVVGSAVGVTVYQDKETNDPLTLVRGAMKFAQDSGFDTLLIDTAGRLHIDDELMVELEQIKAETRPMEVLFVADAMTGQDAVRSAEVFPRASRGYGRCADEDGRRRSRRRGFVYQTGYRSASEICRRGRKIRRD
jgi:signal recognition particle subunit SRP54